MSLAQYFNFIDGALCWRFVTENLSPQGALPQLGAQQVGIRVACEQSLHQGVPQTALCLHSPLDSSLITQPLLPAAAPGREHFTAITLYKCSCLSPGASDLLPAITVSSLWLMPNTASSAHPVLTIPCRQRGDAGVCCTSIICSSSQSLWRVPWGHSLLSTALFLLRGGFLSLKAAWGGFSGVI